MNLKNLIFGTQEAGTVSYGVAGNTREWLPVKEIKNGIVGLTDGRFIKLVEITPVNFYLKSYREQEHIITSFAAYLKIAPDTLQIKVLTQKADLEASMNLMWEHHDEEENGACREMTEKGVYLLNTLAQNQTLRRRFFLVFQYVGGRNATEKDWAQAAAALEKDAMNAAGMLEECGLDVTFLDDEATQTVFDQIINKKSSRFITLGDSIPGGSSDCIAPGTVDTTGKRHIVIDGMYHTILYVAGYGYPTQAYAGWLGFLVEAGEGISLSFFLQRQRKDKVLSKISQTTMINRSRMRDVGDTRADFEQLESAIFSGMFLKDGMNRSSQDFYYMNTLIEVSAETPELLESRVDVVKMLCTANNYIVKRADYRHEQGFLSCLPTLSLDPALSRKSRRNILTDSAAASFPFCSFELFDPDGILLGQNMYNSSVAMLDIFDSKKYSNANMCIMGTSGAGKTYLLQLLALRHRCQGTQVFIIAPLKGHEFRPACEAIGGKYIKLSPASQECVNIMEIRKTTLDVDGHANRDDSILADKIQKLHIFFTLIKPNITYEERHFLDNALVETYSLFGMTHDNESLYDESGELKPMESLENTMSVITNAYMGCNDIVEAFYGYVRERNRTRDPDQMDTTPFDQFVTEVMLINPDVERGLYILEAKIHNYHFSEWVKMLQMCSTNHELKFALQPIVKAMGDAKAMQIESDTQMSQVWKDYIMTVVLMFGIIPILRFANADWYAIITTTPIGKLLITLMLVMALISAFIVTRITKPISTHLGKPS